MANRQVNLTKRVKTLKGWRYCPVVLTLNGRVKPDLVLVDGKQERHPEGLYYIEYWQGSNKRIRISVGRDGNDANQRRIRKEMELQAAISGVNVVPEEDNSKRPLLAAAASEYLDEIKLTRSAATHSAYSLALNDFLISASKTYLDEIERADLLGYLKYMRTAKHLSDRTCFNRFEHIVTFLKAYGIEKLLRKRDWPKFVKEEPESYTEDELEKFFKACDDEERDYFTFYLMTGFRRKEVIYCRWDDIDLKAGVVRVTAKPEWNFRPKDWENRSVPIPDLLVNILKRRAKKNGEGFVFKTKNGTPRKHRTQVLELCKAVARRARLDPNGFWLHKFRATFATRHLQSGVDLRTVQTWLGHKDMESTMRYLTPAEGKIARQKVNETFNTFAAIAKGKQ